VRKIPHEALLDHSLLGIRNGEGIERNSRQGIVGTIHGVEEDGPLLSPHILLPALLRDKGPAEGVGADVVHDAVLGRLVDPPGGSSAGSRANDLASLGLRYQILYYILHRTGDLLTAGQKLHVLCVVFMVCHQDKLHHRERISK
jgi:hypothetical protein